MAFNLAHSLRDCEQHRSNDRVVVLHSAAQSRLLPKLRSRHHWQITTPCSWLQGAVIVSIQSPVGEPRMKRQLDPDQEASEGPIIRPEEHPQ